MSAPDFLSATQTVKLFRQRPAATCLKGSSNFGREAEDGTEAETPQNVPKALGNLLALVGETDRLVDEVQAVMRRIGVELERLGVSASQWGLPDSSRPRACPELDALSPRESEIVQLFMEGHRVSTIARSLFISPHTVRNHLQSVYRKVGVCSQVELIQKLKGLPRVGPLPPELLGGG